MSELQDLFVFLISRLKWRPPREGRHCYKCLITLSCRLFREQLDDIQDYFGGLLDVLERGELHLAVEVQAAGEDVRAWEAFE